MRSVAPNVRVLCASSVQRVVEHGTSQSRSFC